MLNILYLFSKHGDIEYVALYSLVHLRGKGGNKQIWVARILGKWVNTVPCPEGSHSLVEFPQSINPGLQ